VAGRGEFGAGCWIVVDRVERQSEKERTLFFFYCVPKQQSQELDTTLKIQDARFETMMLFTTSHGASCRTVCGRVESAGTGCGF
jgi:hypothetical protein